MTVDTQPLTVTLTALSLAGEWNGFVIPLPSFPAPERQLQPARELVRRVTGQLLKHTGGRLETFLQLTQLHLGDGAQRVSSHGKEWIPAMGLGVWPDREPPHAWTMTELRDLVPTDNLRPLMDIALHVTRSEQGGNVCEVMLGLGTILQFVVPSIHGEDFFAASKQLLLPPIKDPSYTSFPFYVPLFEAKSVAKATESQLESWLCGATACVRESPEDQGILIFAKAPMEQILSQAGVKSEGHDTWRISS